MDADLRMQIAGLRKQTTLALKSQYRALFREESPSSNREHLIRRVAWRLQALALGDLSERARARAAELAADADLRVRPTRMVCLAIAGEPGQGSDANRDRRLPAVGRIIKREYHGRVIEVTVVEGGFQHEGKLYKSLSSVAKYVTGTRWNGYAFFKLHEEAKRV